MRRDLPVVASDGLASWTTFVLDGLLSARIVHADQLHGLDADELTVLARAALVCSMRDFNPDQIIEEIRQKSSTGQLVA